MPFATPPVADFKVEIDDAAVRFFEDNGYLAVGRITTDEELEWLRGVYDSLLDAPRSGLLDGVFDLTQPYGATTPPEIGQLLFPERRVPDVRQTAMWKNARRIATRLLRTAPDEVEHWGHLIFKPAESGSETPWHQDEAYWDVNLDYNALGAWMPLEPVDVESGCLWFVPGSHRREVLPHRHLGDDPFVHVLELKDPVDTSAAVPIPLEAGAATFHHSRTIHYAGPNRGKRIRRAWANEFQTSPVQRAEPHDRPWVIAGREALAESAARRR